MLHMLMTGLKSVAVGTNTVLLHRSVSAMSLPAIFSSAMLPHEIAGLTETLEQIKNADPERARLAHNATYLRYNQDSVHDS